ncbi:MAG: hypothetical protein ACYDG2_00945 [Ruminiclostridium sp.]
MPFWEKAGENELPPLSNLFVVATNARGVYSGNPFKLKSVLDTKCGDFQKTLTPDYWDEREKATGYNISDYGTKSLRNRFFTYEIDIPDLCTEFRTQLQAVTETLPNIITKRTKEFVTEYAKRKKLNIEQEIAKYEDIINERNKYFDLLEEIDNKELERAYSNSKRKKTVKDEIKKLKHESVLEFTDYFSSTISVDSIISLMQRRDVSNKQNEVDTFISYLQGLLQEQCAKILGQKSDVLTVQIKSYITSGEAISTVFEKHEAKADFNAEWAFASALAKIGLVGGLGAFLISTGLGVALGVTGLLFGAAGIVSTVLRFLCPIGLAIGLLLSGILGLITLLGGGWRKSVAKKIVNAMEENKILEKYSDSIRDYWNTTEITFDQATGKLDEDWKAYVDRLRDIVNNYDIDEIKEKIATLRDLNDFFSNIQL